VPVKCACFIWILYRGCVCCNWGRCPQTPSLPGAWPAVPCARARPGGRWRGEQTHFAGRVLVHRSRGRPPSPPFLRPASPMRFVIYLLGLRQRHLSPDLSNAQFILIATKQTELVNERTLYNFISIHALWGVGALFALVGGLVADYGRPPSRNAEISEIPDHITGTPEFRLVIFRPEPHEFRPKRRNSGDFGVSHRNAETVIRSQCWGLYLQNLRPAGSLAYGAVRSRFSARRRGGRLIFRARTCCFQKELHEAVRARTTIPHFVLLITLLVVLASSIGGYRLFLGTVSLCRPPPHQDRGRARTAGNRFARDGKVPGPQLGAKQLPGERPRESAET